MIEILKKDGKKVFSSVNLSEMEGKNILITGASGLIGINILSILKNINNIALYTVFTTDNDILFNLLSDTNKIYLKCDLTSHFPDNLPMFDYIVHAACYGQPGKFMEDQIKTIQLNTEVLNKLIKKLKQNGKFLFISSSEVYSGLSNSPFNEEQIGTTNTTHDRSCYIESKRCGETICNIYRKQGLNMKVARVSLAYGPGTRKNDKRVLNNFIQKALQNKNITMMDNGGSIRTYSYISDTVENLLNILLFGKDFIYNVGGYSRMTILELAENIGKILKVPIILPKDENKIIGSPDDVYVDMSKIENEFHKIEYINMDFGLRNTIEYQKKLYNI